MPLFFVCLFVLCSMLGKKETHQVPGQVFFFSFPLEEWKAWESAQSERCVRRCASLSGAFECRCSLLSGCHTYLLPMHIKGTSMIHSLQIVSFSFPKYFPTRQHLSSATKWTNRWCAAGMFGPHFLGLYLEFLFSSIQDFVMVSLFSFTFFFLKQNSFVFSDYTVK